MTKLPVLGLMLGDVTGIGPEISVKLLASGMPNSVARVVVIGDARVFDQGCRDAGIRLACRVYDSVDAVEWNGDAVPLIDLGNIDPAKFPRSVSSDESGKLSGDTLKHMIDLADACKIDFDMQYEFSSIILEQLVGPVFGMIANTMVDSF